MDEKKPNSNDKSTLLRWFESFMIALCMMALVVFGLVVYSAHSATCLTLEVQPSQVLGNYDGDTFAVSLGALGIASIRVEGVDTPERNKKQPGWEAARAFTAAWLARGPFRLSTCFEMTFGRLVGTPSRDGETLAAALTKAGHVKPVKE